MKSSTIKFTEMDDYQCIRPGGTIIQTIKWALLLVIGSIFYLGLPLTGYGTEDPLTIEERVWLNQHSGKIVVNNEAGWPPIIDTDKDGNSFGIVMDYQRLLEKKLDFTFKLDKLDSWNNFMERFKKGKIDVNNNLQKTPERSEYALFTKPYIEISNVIITRKEIKGSMILEKMRGMKIAVTRDFAIHNYLKKNYDYLQLVPFQTDLECLLETSTKSVDAAVVNLAVASFFIENSGIANLRVTGYAEYKNELCFASRKDWPILNQILEKGLNLITPAERDAIFKKWISLGYEPFYKSRNFWIVSCSAAALIFTFTILILGWNRSLKRQVQLRTEKLEMINIQLKDEIEERKQAEGLLRKSEEKYKSLANNLNVGIFRNTVGSEGEFLEANPAIVKMFGFDSRDEFLKLRVIDLYKNSNDKKKYNEKLLREGAVKNEELELRKKDGTSFIGSVSAVVVKNEENKVKYYDGIVEDITERKLAELQLSDALTKAQRFHTALDHVPVYVYMKDTQSRYIYANSLTLKLFGCSAEELIGCDDTHFFPTDAVKRLQGIDSRVFAGEQTFEEIDVKDTEVSRRVFWEVKTPIYAETERKKIWGLLGISTDITELKLTEEALRKRKSDLALAQSIAHLGNWSWDVNTNTVEWSDEMYLIYGVDRNTFNHTIEGVAKLIHPDDLGRQEHAISELLARRSVKSYEYRVIRPDGTERVVEVAGMRVEISEDNKVRRLFGIAQDITERKRMEEELLRAQKMESIGTLTGGIAHDFNNIMSIILGNTEMALEDVPKSNLAYSKLEEINTASLRAANIVRQLLSFTRKTDQKLQPIQIALVIKDALKFLRSTIPTTIDIEQDIFVTDETILADPTQINQIIMNLCINASQAMEQMGGNIKVIVEKVILDDNSSNDYPALKSGNYIKIMVSDTGPGIEPKIIERIFDPYFTTKDIGKGSGMGLAVVHGIVKSHGGAISVDSRPDQGTRFSILFPLAQGKAAVETQTIQEIPRGSETILFVDDEISIVKMMQRMFELLGYEVETAITPQDALERFALNPDHFDLVITDMTMPQMTGVKLSKKIVAIRPDIPIIICTGHSALVDEEKAKELGLAAYVMKPINMPEIAQTIRKVLDKK